MGTVCLVITTTTFFDSVSQLLGHSLVAGPAAYEVLGQSVANKMKDILLSNDKAERWISDIAEDTEMQLIVEIKKLKLSAIQLDGSTDI